MVQKSISQYHSNRVRAWLDGIAQDIRFAIRLACRSPWLTASIIASLSIGIGAANAIFNVADQAIFRDLPYPNSDELFVLGDNDQQLNRFIHNVYPFQLEAYKNNGQLFSEYAVFDDEFSNLVISGEPGGAKCGKVSVDYFRTLGIKPVIGRSFGPDDYREGNDNIIILSHKTWMHRFGGEASILDRDVVFGDRVFRVVGVLPKSFIPPLYQNADIYRPLVIPVLDNPFKVGLQVIARIKSSSSAEQVRVVMNSIQYGKNLVASPRILERLAPEIKDLKTYSNLHLTTPYFAFLAAVGILYTIACANAANLLITRIIGRQRELSIRLSLGIRQARIAQMLLIEAILISTVSSIIGIIVALWLTPVLKELSPSYYLSNGSQIDLNWYGLLFPAGIGLITAILIFLWPLVATRQFQPIRGLKQGGIASSESRGIRLIRNSMVVLEAALAVILLTAACLIFRSVWNLRQVDIGMDPHGLIGVNLEMPKDTYSSVEARQVFMNRLDERLQKVPEIIEVAYSGSVPFAGYLGGVYSKPDGTLFRYGASPVSQNFKDTLGIKIIKGRWFEKPEEMGANIAIISETFAKDTFGDDDPIGKPLEEIFGGEVIWSVVGVANDVRTNPRENPGPHIYFPYSQKDLPYMSIVLRVKEGSSSIIEEVIHRTLYEVDPLVAARSPVSLSEAAESQLKAENYALLIFKILSAFALILSAFGLFSIMAYSVEKQRREIGIRIALGAMPWEVFSLIMRRGVTLVGFGLVTGILLSLTLTRFLTSVMYEISPLDPTTLISVVLILFFIAVASCWIPARKAARINAMEAIREE